MSKNKFNLQQKMENPSWVSITSTEEGEYPEGEGGLAAVEGAAETDGVLDCRALDIAADPDGLEGLAGRDGGCDNEVARVAGDLDRLLDLFLGARRVQADFGDCHFVSFR